MCQASKEKNGEIVDQIITHRSEREKKAHRELEERKKLSDSHSSSSSIPYVLRMPGSHGLLDLCLSKLNQSKSRCFMEY